MTLVTIVLLVASVGAVLFQIGAAAYHRGWMKGFDECSKIHDDVFGRFK